MDIRHLRIFLAVVETGSMNKAAKQLFIAQPTVSQAIKELEEYYDVLLFERLNQKLVITDQGKKLFSLASDAVEVFDHLEITMKNVAERPLLKIGSSVSVGTALLPEKIALFEEKKQNVSVNVVVNNTTAIERMLLSGELDAAIVEGMIESEDLLLTPIYKDELVIVVGKKHPFYQKDFITLEVLNNQEAIMRENDSNQRNYYEQILRDHNIILQKKWLSTNTEAIKKAVITSRKLAILSTMIVQDEVKRGELHIVRVEGIKATRDINLVIHKNKYISKALEQFIQFCKEQ